MRYTLAVVGLLVCANAQPARAQTCEPSTRSRVACVTLQREADVVLNVTVDDRFEAVTSPVAAFSIVVDGDPVEELLIFQGTGRRSYGAIVGPLSPGNHRLTLTPSRFWPEPTVGFSELTTRIASPSDPDFLVIHHAPAIWARADTIGQTTDLLLMMYAEQSREADSAATLTYSTIFSNEDGGTSTRALMARWGRTTDIEWMYRVAISSEHVVNEQFQAADHQTREFHGKHVGSHPVLLVATLNNVFGDTGRTAVLMRPLPVSVDLSAATRESVMDPQPWMYRVMDRELADEGKIRSADRKPSRTVIDDPRSYLFVEARLRLRHAATTAIVEDERGTFHTSNLGSLDLSLARNGYVRVAVPMSGRPARAIGWMCLPLQESSNLAAGETEEQSDCNIEQFRAFRLNDSFEVEPVSAESAQFQLSAGEMRTIASDQQAVHRP